MKRFAKIHAWAFCRRDGAKPERYHMESEHIVDRLLQGKSWEGWRTFDGIKKCMACQETFKNPFLHAFAPLDRLSVDTTKPCRTLRKSRGGTSARLLPF